MIQWSSIDSVPDDFADTAVTIGKFDGVHLGHLKLLAELTEAAEQAGLSAVVVTFDRHPDALLNPSAAKLPLIGPLQKRHLLLEAGVDATLTLPFDETLSSLSPADFVDTILVKTLRAKIVLVGEGFRFGHHGAGDVATLRQLGAQHGFLVREVSHAAIDGEKVSTTRIREILDEGNVAKASSMLGRDHINTGIIEHGLKIGRTIGFPTANLSRSAEGYLPLDGVYAGWLYADGQRYPAAHSVGINETFQAVPRLVESHVLDRKDLDLYDKVVTLEYIEFVRPSAKFNGVEELIEAINCDLDKIREILGVDTRG